MSNILPQQQLLLELIIISGDIGVPDAEDSSIFCRTMNECKAKGWIKISTFGGGYNKLSITDYGRNLVNSGKPTPQKTA
jgi:hypothetical protein